MPAALVPLVNPRIYNIRVWLRPVDLAHHREAAASGSPAIKPKGQNSYGLRQRLSANRLAYLTFFDPKQIGYQDEPLDKFQMLLLWMRQIPAL